LARRPLTKQQLRAIHAKNGGGVSLKDVRGESVPSRTRSHTSKQATIRRPARKPAIIIPKGDIRSHLTEAEIQEWEKVVGSELGAETGTFEGRNTVEVKFQNGEDWFEFQTIKEQTEFFEKNFEKSDKVGEFIEVDHPKIEGYVNLISGISLFKDRMMEK